MPSRLVGLMRNLTWSDFTSISEADPGPGFAIGAETHAGITHNSLTTKVEAIPGSAPARYRLKDDVIITVTFGRDSWVKSWVMGRPQAFQDRMLNHEQGHYNIVALLARDLFIDLMQLKNASMDSNRAMAQEIVRVWTQGTQKAQAIQNLYDDVTETHHGANPVDQARWDGFITTAFTQTRVPPMSAPDGTSYKVTLMSVLTGAGLSP